MPHDRKVLGFRYAIIGVIVVAIPVVVYFWCWYPPVKTVVLVRHAERAGTPPGDPVLSSQGQVRAQELAHVASRLDLDRIVTSNLTRTRQTAAPTATAHGLTPIELPAVDIQAFVDQVSAAAAGATVLIVGHSNTVPDIVEALDGPSLPDIDNAEFDRMFVLTLCRCRWGPIDLTELEYGAISP